MSNQNDIEIIRQALMDGSHVARLNALEAVTRLEQSLSVDQILEVVGKALEDHDQVNWQSPPISYNAERDKLLRARLIAKLNQPTK